MPTELPILLVKDLAAWAQWLLQNAESSPGVWLVMAKKGTTTPTSLTLAQALDEALCHGWINGQARSRDAHTVSQRYTPRTAKSTWSQINQGHVARLDAEGRMQPRGWQEVERAKADGRWEAAYAPYSTIEPPKDLLEAVEAVPEAKAMWEVLTKQNRFAFILRLSSVRTEKGRRNNVARAVEMLARGETPHPQKAKAPKTDVEDDVILKPKPSATRMSRAERAESRARRLKVSDSKP